MTTFIYFANLAAILNSLAVIALIINQNDSSKDIFISKNVDQSNRSPMENLTWLLLFTQLCFVLIQIKISAL